MKLTIDGQEYIPIDKHVVVDGRVYVPKGETPSPQESQNIARIMARSAPNFNCEHCKWSRQYSNEEMDSSGIRVWGVCAKSWSDCNIPVMPPTQACVATSSSYYAPSSWLVVQPDHYCSMFEPKK